MLQPSPSSPPVGAEVAPAVDASLVAESPEQAEPEPVERWWAPESLTERLIFGSRWLLSPIYVGLIGGLVVIMICFVRMFWQMARQALTLSEGDVVLHILALLDLALLGNLVLIIMFAGYENFVSKIGAAEDSEDRPHWMGHVDFSGLKIKLIGSLVAISVIELLRDFEQARGEATISHGMVWRVVLHLTFIASGVLFATMDLLGDRRIMLNQRHALELHQASIRDPAAKEAAHGITEGAGEHP